MPITYNRMGVGTCATLIELWLEGELQLTKDEFNKLCDRLVELLGDARDEMWRLQGERLIDSNFEEDTDPDIG